MSEKVVVIGGVAAGASAAAKARRTDEFSKIIIFERGPYVSFANCGLPYYLGGEIKERDELFLVTPERFKERFNIDVFVNHEVVKIHRDRKTVEVINHNSGERFEESYTKLMIATGGIPVRPPLEGADLKNIHSLWTVPDVDAVKTLVDSGRVKHAVIMGGGFVGIETAEALLQKGIQVTIVEKGNQLLSPWDPEMAGLVAQQLRRMGANVRLGVGIRRFLGAKTVEAVELMDSTSLPVDLVIISAGVQPELDLVVGAGLELGVTGGVLVNSRMQTSDPDIYAGGDIVESTHFITGQKVRVPLAGPANKQGRVAGANMVGGNMEFRGVINTSIIKVGPMTAARTGLNEKEAREAGLDYYTTFTVSPDHAGYYPGAEPMIVKLIVEKLSGRLLGGQVVGTRGIDKRIDILATAIYGKMTVFDLENLDLAYAPPFSSAKDPCIMAGFVAANVARGELQTVTGMEVLERLAEGRDVQILDVRTPDEYTRGHIPGAVNIPVDQFRNRLHEIDKTKEKILYCGIGYRSYLAYKILEHHGFKNIKNLGAGYHGWKMVEGLRNRKQ
ncbi:FAD-dependent oxidoreductase [Thermincola potens]|uniref:FAD-dependent pyridine nucleotide-disulfide oxidoreductase n=1 Tax=Thermincola potens (strain JR) TaxID=635013 RepID=D5XDE9_THEPJ|nr:FAD-dependent oxidoreductase [Thermincola potens]ADG81797.1 FAD-dependent pyridine nucleotide-disulfide oxidoreductase [Thermincola potens JR]